MNQVSWSRILQRAGDEHSSENGADIIDIQDRIGGRRGSGMGRGGANPQSQPGDLEMELRGALNRAAYRQPAPQYAVPRPAGERAASNAMPVPRHLNPRSAPRQPQVRAAPRHSEPNPTGIRNFIAISFSVAVVAFAFHQLGGELPNMGDAGSSQDQERSSGQREVSFPTPDRQARAVRAPARTELARRLRRFGSTCGHPSRQAEPMPPARLRKVHPAVRPFSKAMHQGYPAMASRPCCGAAAS
ncbi:MAG: hypothetical protein HC850_12305 [Rhodomicrobium sp.]|nr:hypothetical protein [Rhodomicrobium sp.]